MSTFLSGVYLLALNGNLYIAKLTPDEVLDFYLRCMRQHTALSFLCTDADDGAVNDPRNFAANTDYQGLLNALAAVVA